MTDKVDQLLNKVTSALGSAKSSITAATTTSTSEDHHAVGTSDIGLIGLGVMGQNLALNIAEKGYKISVYNRTYARTEDTIKRSFQEKLSHNLKGYKDINDFVASIKKPRAVIILVTAGKPVDETIKLLMNKFERNDIIIDGGNEWYENTERRQKDAEAVGIQYMGMGVSGGEEGARHGPSLMPGGPYSAYQRIEPILKKIAAQVDDGPCVTYIGPGGAGNYVKMIHNGIEYGDMQLIAEAYDLLKLLGGLTNDELHQTFKSWNQGDLQSFLIEITAQIFTKKDNNNRDYLVDKVLDKTGSKGTGKWTVQTAAEFAVPIPTVASALEARYISALKEERVNASKILRGPADDASTKEGAAARAGKIDKASLVRDVGDALYAAKICSYAQGMNVIKTAGEKNSWNLNLGEIARIWKGGCIIRAKFLNRIKAAYDKDSKLVNLLIDPSFAAELNERQDPLRRVLVLAIQHGVSAISFSNSIAYYDSYRRARLPANLTQSQRDYFGAHTYERVDAEGWFHSEWAYSEPDKTADEEKAGAERPQKDELRHQQPYAHG